MGDEKQTKQGSEAKVYKVLRKMPTLVKDTLRAAEDALSATKAMYFSKTSATGDVDGLIIASKAKIVTKSYMQANTVLQNNAAPANSRLQTWRDLPEKLGMSNLFLKRGRALNIDNQRGDNADFIQCPVFNMHQINSASNMRYSTVQPQDANVLKRLHSSRLAIAPYPKTPCIVSFIEHSLHISPHNLSRYCCS